MSDMPVLRGRPKYSAFPLIDNFIVFSVREIILYGPSYAGCNASVGVSCLKNAWEAVLRSLNRKVADCPCLFNFGCSSRIVFFKLSTKSFRSDWFLFLGVPKNSPGSLKFWPNVSSAVLMPIRTIGRMSVQELVSWHLMADFNCLLISIVELFCHPISLWIICCDSLMLGSREFRELSEEIWFKLSILIGSNSFWNTVSWHPCIK